MSRPEPISPDPGFHAPDAGFVAQAWQPGRIANPQHAEMARLLLSLERAEQGPDGYTPAQTIRLVLITCGLFWAACGALYFLL